MDTNYLYNFAKSLRENEEVVLYNNLLEIKEQDSIRTTTYLQQAYNREALNYPNPIPAFDADAALWAAKTIYTFAQLLLYRSQEKKDLEQVLPPYKNKISAAAIISADLTLRFLPDFHTQFFLIDQEDIVLPIIDSVKMQWHYSFIKKLDQVDNLDFTSISADSCLYQLYVDRVVQNKNAILAKHPLIMDGVKSIFGIYQSQFWSNFNL